MSNKPVRPTEDQVHLSWKKKKRRAGQERAHIFRASSASVDMTSTAVGPSSLTETPSLSLF